MKTSIITVCYNSAATIRDTIESVLRQSCKAIEFIIVDGGSEDGTVDLISSYGSDIDIFISEPDKGMYNAMNKGIRMATGNIVGILNSDDFFTDDYVIQMVQQEFIDNNIDALFGDVQFVNPINLSKVVRYYSSEGFNPEKFRFGIMPAHPSFYVKRELFDKFGYYKEDYKIGADFDLLIRFLYNTGISYKYIKQPFVSMRTGGVSNKSIYSRILLNSEIARACKENGVNTNMFNIYSKYIKKVFEFFHF